jgi:phage terminase large subunit-like protein
MSGLIDGAVAKYDWQSLEFEFYKYPTDSVAKFLADKEINYASRLYKTGGDRGQSRTVDWVKNKQDYKNNMQKEIVQAETTALQQSDKFKQTIANMAKTKYNVLNKVMALLTSSDYELKDIPNIEKALNMLNNELGLDSFTQEREVVQNNTVNLSWVVNTESSGPEVIEEQDPNQLEVINADEYESEEL